MSVAVALILDRDFGDRVLEFARAMPIWVISSEKNDQAIEKTRRLLDGRADITKLLAQDTEPLHEVCLRGLYNIDQHLGAESTAAPYDRLLVFGCSSDSVTPQTLRDLGLSNIVVQSDLCFTLKKRG